MFAVAAGTDTTPVDPYNNEFLIPLADFIEHPLAHELVHNGQTLQVISLTTGSGHTFVLCTIALNRLLLHVHKSCCFLAVYEHTTGATFHICGLSLVSSWVFTGYQPWPDSSRRFQT